jgi:hypothetical protein
LNKRKNERKIKKGKKEKEEPISIIEGRELEEEQTFQY